MFQYEIEKREEKNLIIYFEIEKELSYTIYYLIDIGFEGYCPLEFNFYSLKCLSNCSLYIPNYHNELSTKLVEGEKLFLYYYVVSTETENPIATIKGTYYSLNYIQNNNGRNFFVINPKTDND